MMDLNQGQANSGSPSVNIPTWVYVVGGLLLLFGLGFLAYKLYAPALAKAQFKTNAPDWKQQAKSIQGMPYNENSLNWNSIASGIQQHICGLGGGAAPGPCLISNQDKVIGLFKGLNVQPTGELIRDNKIIVQAYLDSGESNPHYNTTKGIFLK